MEPRNPQMRGQVLRMLLQFRILLTVLVLYVIPGSSRPVPVQHGRQLADLNQTVCPVSFNYVRKFPENLKLCEGKDAICCPALLNTLAIGLAEYLRDNGGFEFPDMATVSACLTSYQQALGEAGVTKDFVGTCFPSTYPSTAMFIQSPVCAGIVNISDWNRVVGPHPLDSSCRGDLSGTSDCRICNDDLIKAVTELQSRSSNQTDRQCVYVACLYAAGVVNRLGPQDPGTASCILGLTVAGDSKNRSAGLYIGLGVGVPLAAALVLAAIVYKLMRVQRRKKSLLSMEKQQMRPNLGMIQFNYQELKLGTKNFSEKNFLGEGAFGKVYKGVLPSYENMQVAVKVMKDSSADSCGEFLNEVEVINRIRHRNLVQVRGGSIFVDENGEHRRILVYDYMPNGCLEAYLSEGTKRVLSWPERRKIAIGTAVGINYLHNEVQPAIVHRDIKPSNILLDENFDARVADFGLAKMTVEGSTELITRVAGTPLYMAVEYALYGQCSEKVDVYSFGIVLLELMSGRKALDATEGNTMPYHIVDWAWSLVKAGQVQDIIDERIRGTGSVRVMERFVLVGILCAHLLVCFRPPIAVALKMLEGDEEIPEIPDRPAAYIWAGQGGKNETLSVASQTECSAPIVDSVELLR